MRLAFSWMGHCTTEPLAERRRAAWAAVWTDGNGIELGRLSGVVPAHYPQSPQAAEYLAGLAAAHIASPDQTVFSDCANVVRSFTADAIGQLDGRRRYSGIVKAARAGAGWVAAQRMLKVKAHVDIADDMSQEDLVKARGNGAADAAAKAALQQHQGPSQSLELEWCTAWSDAVITARLIGAVGSLWPSARPPKGTRLPRACRAEADARLKRREDARGALARTQQDNFASHHWVQVRGLLRCQCCAVRWDCTAAASCTRCVGFSQFFEQVTDSGRSNGHQLFRASVCRPGEDAAPLLGCFRCGAWCETGKSLALLGQCKRPSRHGADAIRRVRLGLYPKAGKAGRGGVVEGLVLV